MNVMSQEDFIIVIVALTFDPAYSNENECCHEMVCYTCTYYKSYFIYILRLTLKFKTRGLIYSQQ
jgi:hypothetical protein